MAAGFGEEEIGQKIPNWGYYEANFLVEIWADEEIQRQLLAISEKKAQYMGKHRRKAQ